MNNKNETIRNILNLLDNQLTDAEFDQQVEQNRFLAECKAKKFNRLQSMGLIGKKEVSRRPTGITKKTAEQRQALATEGYRLVTEELLFPPSAAERLGIHRGTLKAYWKEAGIHVPSNEVIRSKRDRETAKKALHLINRRAYTIKRAAEELGMSDSGMVKVLFRRGYKYNRHTQTLERLSK